MNIDLEVLEEKYGSTINKKIVNALNSQWEVEFSYLDFPYITHLEFENISEYLKYKGYNVNLKKTVDKNHISYIINVTL